MKIFYSSASPYSTKVRMAAHFAGLAAQSVAQSYTAACTPDFFLFDERRELVYRGQFDASRPNSGVPVMGADLRAALEALLGGKPVPAAQKPSLGCNIKWRAGNEPAYYGAR